MNSAGKICLFKPTIQGKVLHLLSLLDSMIPNNAVHTQKERLLPQKVNKIIPLRKMILPTMTQRKLMSTIQKTMKKL